MSKMRCLGLPEKAIRRLEKLSGIEFPRIDHPALWLSLGLGLPIDKALRSAGLTTLDDLDGPTREEMLLIPGLGPGSLRSIEEATGMVFRSSALYWRRLGCSQRLAARLSCHHIMGLGGAC